MTALAWSVWDEAPLTGKSSNRSLTRGLNDLDGGGSFSLHEETWPLIKRNRIGFVATLLTVFTYQEDAWRCISGWSGQHEYVASIIGSRFLAYIFLAMIVVSQLSSVALLFPWASQTRRAAIISAGVCCALACSIVVQPIVYNQLDNVSLITMFAGQLGSLFLLLCLDYEALRDCVSCITENSSEASKKLEGWFHLSARCLLTVDISVVYGQALWAACRDGEYAPSHIGLIDARAVAWNLFTMTSCIGLWLGFYTRTCASSAALAIFIDAFSRFPFWKAPSFDEMDVSRFHFFQAVALSGGLLLLAARGPGHLSMDATKKYD